MTREHTHKNVPHTGRCFKLHETFYPCLSISMKVYLYNTEIPACNQLLKIYNKKIECYIQCTQNFISSLCFLLIPPGFFITFGLMMYSEDIKRGD